MDRYVLRDADHRADAGVDRLVDRVGGEAGGNEDQRRVRACLVDCVGDRIEDGHALDVLAALSRRHAGDDVRAVCLVAQAVEAALAAREALDQKPRVVVDDDRHYLTPLITSVGSGIHPSLIRSPSSSRTRAWSAGGVSVRSSHG